MRILGTHNLIQKMDNLKAMNIAAESLRACIEELHRAMNCVTQNQNQYGNGDPRGHAVEERKRKIGVMMDEAIDAATIKMKRIAKRIDEEEEEAS
jgi:fructose-1,6-bisphosphatase